MGLGACCGLVGLGRLAWVVFGEFVVGFFVGALSYWLLLIA